MPLVSKPFGDIITFSRASSATFVGSNGLIQTTPQSKNLLLWTQEFDQASWTKTNATVSANSAVAPDGTTTADTFTAAAANAVIGQAFVSVTSAYTFSIWARRVNGSGSIDINGGASWVTQTVTSTWQRLSVTQSLSAGVPSVGVRIVTSGDVIEVWGAQLEVGSSATSYTKNDGGLFPPRFDYDPVTLAAKGLLIEEQRTNLLLRSDDFSTGWSPSNAAVTANAALSPDGTNNGDKIITNNAAINGQVFQSISKAASATTYTSTVFAKAGEWNTVGIYVSDSASFSNRADINVNLSTGAISSAATARGTFTAASGSVTAFGNGWYRVSLTFTSSTETALLNRIYSLDSVATNGDGTSGIFIWGAQLEAGSFATSYIPTVASQVTRSADVASVNTLSPWFNASSGSFYAEADITGAPASNRLFEVHDGTDNNRLFTYTVNSSNSTRFHGVAAGASTEAIAASSSPTSGVPFKTAGAFTAGEYAVCYNGGTVATAAPAALPTGLSAMVLGARRSGAQVLNGHLRRLTFYPRRLSNAELVSITA